MASDFDGGRAGGSSEDCAGHAGRDGSSGDCEGVLFVKQMTIAVQEAIVTLYNPPMERAISSPPVKPKGGQGFLYVAESSANEGSY